MSGPPASRRSNDKENARAMQLRILQCRFALRCSTIMLPLYKERREYASGDMVTFDTPQEAQSFLVAATLLKIWSLRRDISLLHQSDRKDGKYHRICDAGQQKRRKFERHLWVVRTHAETEQRVGKDIAPALSEK